MTTSDHHPDLAGRVDQAVLLSFQAQELAEEVAMEVAAEWAEAWASWEVRGDRAAASQEGGRHSALRPMRGLITS